MDISEVHIPDLKAIKAIARDAVNLSVQATESEKQGLLNSITSDIDAYSGNHSSCYLCARDNDGIIHGYIVIKDHWNLAHLFVAPSSHGKGLGRKLLDCGIVACQNVGNLGYLRVNSSLNAVRFYEKLDFVPNLDVKAKAKFAVPLIYYFPGHIQT